MTYTITGKNGVTPNQMQGTQSHKSVMGYVTMFLLMNNVKQSFADDAEQIAYYNRKSFYNVVGA